MEDNLLFLGIPIIPMFKYMRGRFEQNNSIGYVSNGAGSWFPYRIGCPPEVTFFKFLKLEKNIILYF